MGDGPDSGGGMSRIGPCVDDPYSWLVVKFYQLVSAGFPLALLYFSFLIIGVHVLASKYSPTLIGSAQNPLRVRQPRRHPHKNSPSKETFSQG